MTRRSACISGILLCVSIVFWVAAVLRLTPQDFLWKLRNVPIPFFSIEEQRSYESESFLVARVVDGDTIELENGQKVRYIGIDTPESVKPGVSVQCFAKEASAFNKMLVEGKSVRLEHDVSDKDKYGRLLRFVYLEDGTFVNQVLVEEGYASVASFPPDISKQDVFRRAEQTARERNVGLWNEATCNGKK